MHSQNDGVSLAKLVSLFKKQRRRVISTMLLRTVFHFLLFCEQLLAVWLNSD